MVKACCTTLPSVMVSTTSRRLAFRVNLYSPERRSFCALRMSEPAMNSVGWSITPSRTSRSAVSRIPPRGMLTTLSSVSGPGVSKCCLPSTNAVPPASAIRKIKVSRALPAITNGLRVRREGLRVGNGTPSGCKAARGLRGGRESSEERSSGG